MPTGISRRGRDIGILGLGLTGGAVDAITYLGLGHAFPANMTGNTVLLAIAIARGASADALRAAVALGGYSIGVVIGVLLDRGNRAWPGGSSVPLLVQSMVMLALLGAWVALGTPSGATRYVLLGAAGATMGVQTTVAGAAHVGGVATTYITGTLTNALVVLGRRLVERPETPRTVHAGELAGSVWLVYGLGALAGALAELSWQGAAFGIPTAIVCLIAAVALAEHNRLRA